MLVVQIVEILWTKATRGAPRSNERVSLPRSFPINGATGHYFVQRHRIAEWEGFQPKHVKSEEKQSVPGSEDLLRISRSVDGSFLLGLSGAPDAGQPKRYAVPKALTIHPGEYARLMVNARHTTYSGQYYSEVVYNVANDAKIQADRFLLGAPDHELDLKADLF